MRELKGRVGLAIAVWAAVATLFHLWTAGFGFNYKVFTLDLRYYGTDLNRGDCNAFTSDHTAALLSPAYVTTANPGGIGSNWCDSRFIAKGSFDLTYQGNLK